MSARIISTGPAPFVITATTPVLPTPVVTSKPSFLASAASLVFRYRRSRGEQRQQLKWIVFAAAFVGLSYMIAMVLSFVFPSESWFAPGSPLWLDLVAYEAVLSFVAIPIAVGFAILKYRLYNIDLLINRTLVYGSLTATLALIYFGGVVGLQYAFRALTAQGSTLAVVASTPKFPRETFRFRTWDLQVSRTSSPDPAPSKSQSRDIGHPGPTDVSLRVSRVTRIFQLLHLHRPSQPPSTGRIVPWMKSPAAEDRKTTAPLRSSGSP